MNMGERLDFMVARRLELCPKMLPGKPAMSLRECVEKPRDESSLISSSTCTSSSRGVTTSTSVSSSVSVCDSVQVRLQGTCAAAGTITGHWTLRKAKSPELYIHSPSLFRSHANNEMSTVQESRIRHWSRWLPHDCREAILGDLLEDCCEYANSGVTERRIHRHAIRQILLATVYSWPAVLIVAVKRVFSTK